MRALKWLSAVMLLIAAASAPAGQNIVRNGSMELGQGPAAPDPRVPASWTKLGVNIERNEGYNFAPPGAGHSLKAFGDNDNTSVAMYQEVLNVAPGQTVNASVQMFSPANDKLRGSGQAGIVIEFLRINGSTISVYTTYPLNTASPADTWIPGTLGPISAPANTDRMRFTCRLFWTPGDIGGAAWWDDAQLVVNGVNRLVNGNFETAGIGAGQSPIGIDEWTGWSDQEKSGDVARHGGFSLKLGARDAYSGLYQFMDQGNAGDQIRMLAYAMNPSIQPLTDNSRAGLKLEFNPNTAVPAPEENLAFDENSPNDVWTNVELNTVVPAGAGIARIVIIYFGNNPSAGSVYADQADVRLGSNPGMNQLENADFESGLGGPGGLDNWVEFRTPGVSQAEQDCLTYFLDGECSVKCLGTAAAGIWQEVEVAPGDTIDVSAKFFSPTADPLTGVARAGVKIEWFAGGVPPDVDIGVPNVSPNTIGAGAPLDVWIPITVDFDMPPGSSAQLQATLIIEKGSAFTGRVYFDAAEVVIRNRFNGADHDADDDEDLIDFAGLQKAYAGGGVMPSSWPWLVYDHDEDDDVDLANTEYFLPRWTNPALP